MLCRIECTYAVKPLVVTRTGAEAQLGIDHQYSTPNGEKKRPQMLSIVSRILRNDQSLFDS
jgi:hypothetical protein